MNISEAIVHLQKLKEKHGDVELLHYCDDCCSSYMADQSVLIVDEDKLNDQMEKRKAS